VDGGLLEMTRRPDPLLSPDARESYRQFVHDVFTSRGRGIAEILANVSSSLGKRGALQLLKSAGIRFSSLPTDLSAEQWARLFTTASPTTSATTRRTAHRAATARPHRRCPPPTQPSASRAVDG